MDFRRHHITPGSPTHLTQVLYVTAYMLFNTHDMHNMHAVQLYICLSAQLAVFVHNLQQWCNAFICYQKKAACSLLFDVFPSWQSLLAVCCITALSCNPPPPSSVPTPHFVSVSCHFPSGMERDSPYDLERSSDRRLPVKKPCYPQYRNRSLDCPAGTRCMYLFRLLLVCVWYDNHVAGKG